MNKKIIFITIAIIALLAQLNPMWLSNAWWIFWRFFVEKILEGGFFKEVVIGADVAGNSIVSKCLADSSCIGLTLFEGCLSILFFIVLVIPIWSFFSVKGIESEQIYFRKRNIFFLIINILTIILSIVFIILNGGFLPRL